MKKYILSTALCMGITILTGCGRSTDNQTTRANATVDSEAADELPVLYNLGGVQLPTDIADFNVQTLDIAHGKNVLVFLFGQPLPQNPGEPQRINPNLEFGGLKEPIELVSAIDGVVGFIQEQTDSNDYEVFLMTSENSPWIIGYDHVTDLQVVQGQTVAVGDVLGKAAAEHNGYYRYELQINQEAGEDTIMLCPTDLLDTSVQSELKATFDSYVDAWNTSYRALYGEDAYAPQSGGCIKPTITNAESQGI